MEYDVQKLLTRLKQLEDENACLKQLLDEAGISYSTSPQIHTVDSMACFVWQSNKEKTSLRTGFSNRPLACWI